MSDSQRTEAERSPQPWFRFGRVLAALILFAAVLLIDRLMHRIPDRQDRGPANAVIHFSPVELDGPMPAGARIAGAWSLTSADPRLGGVSALALDGRRLLALTDSGAVLRFDRPGPAATSRAVFRDLPGGPGSGAFKRNRDSEALARDAAGRGWWVAFENRHELWLYSPDFYRALKRVRLGSRWRVNAGIEGAVAAGEGLLLLPESGDMLLSWTGQRLSGERILNPGGRMSDALSLGPNRLIGIERRVTPGGFRNALVRIDRGRGGNRIAARLPLPLGPLDNAEAIAAERHGEGLRLWLMTDDNFQRPLRTLLVAIDLPPAFLNRG